MAENAFHRFLNLFGNIIQSVLRVSPFSLFKIKRLGAAFALNDDVFPVNRHHLAYHSIEKPPFRVVLYEHNLRSLFQYETLVGRIRSLRERAFHLGLERILGIGQSREFAVIDRLRLIVVRG